MNPRQFYELVRELRKAQQLYFSTKEKAPKQEALRQARAIEDRVDAEIVRVECILAKREKRFEAWLAVQPAPVLKLVEKLGLTPTEP